MEAFLPISIGVLGLVASFFERSKRTQQFLFGLTGIALIWTAKPGFAADDNQTMVLGILSAIAALGLLSGLLIKKYGEWVALAGTLLGLILSGSVSHFFGFEIDWSPTIALLPFIGGLIPLIASLKGTLISRWMGGDRHRLSTGVAAFLAALIVFYATFQAQYLGVILVGTGWLAVALALKSTNRIASGMALLSLGFLFALLKQHPTIDTSFLRGNFLMGLVAGIAALSWATTTRTMKKGKWLMGYLVPLLIILLMVFMGKANENFGGNPAYVGALLGSSLIMFITRFGATVVPLQSLIVALSVIVLAEFAPQAEKKTRLETATTATAGETGTQAAPDVLDIAAIPLTPAMAGDWKSFTDNSKVEFQLGPEGGVTKGAVTEFKVQLHLNAAGEPEKLDVKMPTATVTTLNKMRDETVLGATYLNAAKFPTMTYVSSAIKKEGDKYVVSGDFTMLGIKEALNLELKFAATGNEKGKDYLVMVGKSSVDRTKHGMKSDAKIGNVVDVTFEIELRK